MLKRKTSFIRFVGLVAVFLSTAAGFNLTHGEDKAKGVAEQPSAKVSVEAGIVPMPGDEIGISVKFDRAMDRNSRPTAAIEIEKNNSQSFTQGKWSADATIWTFEPAKLAAAEGIGRLVVDGVKTAEGKEMACHDEPFVVGKEPILAKLEEIGGWMLSHRHEFIFVEGYDYRTLLALYEITGKPEYLEAARKGADNLLGKQQPYGHWGTGYGSVYLADTGSALGLFINIYQFATPEQRKRINEALDRYCEMVLVKGDGTGKPFIHEEGWVGIGFRDIKDGKVVGPMNKPYIIATSLTGAEVFAGMYYMHGNEQYKQLAVKATDWLLGTMNDEGVFPYIIDDWDPQRENIWREYLYCASGYAGEGLIAAWTYLSDPEMNCRIEKQIKPHIEWLLRTQNADGSWGEDKTFNSTRGHGSVNVLSWYYNHVDKDPRVSAALRRYYLLLLDKDRKSYTEVARHPIRKKDWKWAIAGEYVSTSLAGRALAEIVKPDVDCYRWKDKKEKNKADGKGGGQR